MLYSNIFVLVVDWNRVDVGLESGPLQLGFKHNVLICSVADDSQPLSKHSQSDQVKWLLVNKYKQVLWINELTNILYLSA